MTIEEIFNYVDEVKPNNYSKEIKTHWLNELEGKIQNEIMLLAQPEYISYVYRSSTELSGLSFPNDHTLLVPRRIKAHVGGELELNGLTLYAANNLKGLEILSISSDGKHLSFEEGSFTATGSAGDSGTLMFDGSATIPLIKFPFDRIYASWLIMKVSEHLEESSQFANSAAQFRDDWNGFAAWYADTYRPADGVPTFKGYYLVGKQGDPGLPGKDGSDGITPMIGENGNWYFGEADTGKPSRGVPGKDGADGHTPVKGTDYWTASDKAEVVAEAAAAVDLTPYAKKTEVPTKTSQLTNDSGFLTSHQDISGKQDKSTLEADVAAKGFTKNTGTYSKPADGIPKSDLAAAVQTSLGKADSALQKVPIGYRTAAAQDAIDRGKVDKVDGKGLSSNDYTAAAKAKVDAIPANPKYTDTVYDDTALKERVATIEGKESVWDAKSDFSGSYNDLTDKPTIPAPVTEQTVSGWGFTKNTGTYSKPAGGIPKADLAAAVQTSLDKADSALQSVPSTYRTAAAQDTIDSGKVDKVTGKGLSTNDYTAAAKAKVDAIPANPKYTDTVYDDTALKDRVATIEGKESAWDAKSDFSGSYNDLTDKTTVLTVVPAKEEVDGNVIIAIEPEGLNEQHYIWLDDSWQVFSPAHYMEAFVHPGDANFTDGTYEGQPAERNTIKFSKSYTNSWTANWRLNVGDAVTISGAGNAENNKTAVIREIYTDDTYMYLRFYEGTFKNDNSDQSIMIKRAVPDLDFVFEHKNRIWGCKGREIFCCHLGSPLNWYEYDSLADGAWAVEIGKGNLTGGFAYNHPLFFTEDVVYTILGNAPEEYSLSATPSTFGCAKGSHRSFAVVRGYLFYHSPYGFCYYYGSMPYLCGDDLGEHYFKEAVGGGKGDKYYVSCLDENNAARTFVYDTRLGVWHEEENAWGQKVAGYAWDGDLYAAMGDGVYTVGIPRNKPSATSEFGAISMPSYVEFAPFYIDSLNKKQIKSILIRHEVKEKLTIKIYVDGEENISLRRVLKGNGVTEIVGIPRRGDQWSLVFEGSGKWRVYSIGYDYYEGSARK